MCAAGSHFNACVAHTSALPRNGVGKLEVVVGVIFQDNNVVPAANVVDLLAGVRRRRDVEVCDSLPV
jgi:hypothetical protein